MTGVACSRWEGDTGYRHVISVRWWGALGVVRGRRVRGRRVRGSREKERNLEGPDSTIDNAKRGRAGGERYDAVSAR